MLFVNPRARRCAYPENLRSILQLARAQENRHWLASWPCITPGATPLHDLPDTAQRLGLACLHVKDEALRSPLGSFKILGAPLALLRHILRQHPQWQPQDILAGHHSAHLKEQEYTVISATDGNHGTSLAAAARDVGCHCTIVLHAQVSSERERAIAALGARIVRIAGNYDASVEHAAWLAAENGWHVISDTSWPGYEEVPRDVMQGYAIIAQEIFEQTGARPDTPGFYTHVFLQGGVGGLAAGICAALWEWHGAQRPHIVIVEPEQADCLLQSARLGRPAHASGSVDSIMAGLACGATSPLAWQFLETGADCFMTIGDQEAIAAMRTLAAGSARDIPVVAGESGVAALAALEQLRHAPLLRAQAGLDENARVLIINTEGATAVQAYRQLVGEDAASVRQRQAAWRAPD